MTNFVFLGPSLALGTARAALDAVFLPPVAMGDLYVLTRTKARQGDSIAIVDGLFERVPAVWHKEILFALSEGVHVYGASSMGALRAAELEPFGMVGIGRVFEAYRDGLIADDDEVAVSHAAAEHGYRSLSVSMVSLRFGLEALADTGRLERVVAQGLIERAKAQHYSQRNWADILRWARDSGADDAQLGAIREESQKPDAKAQDALSLLGILAARHQESKSFEPKFVFNMTSYWVALTRGRAEDIIEEQQGDRFASRTAELHVAKNYRAVGPFRDQLLDAALLDFLILHYGEQIEPEDEELRRAAHGLVRQHQLVDRDHLRQWRRDQRLSDREWHSLLDVEARRHRLRSGLVSRLDPLLLLNLKRRGIFSTCEAAIKMAAQGTAPDNLGWPLLEEATVTPDQLQNWYTARHGPMLPDPESHAHSLGFPTLRDFLDEVMKGLVSEQRTSLADSEESALPRGD